MTVPYVFTPGTTISSAQVNANFAATSTGVADGSNAAAGQIGEVLTKTGNSTSTGIYLTSSNAGTAVLFDTLQLTAGDWDVNAECGGMPTGTATPDPNGASTANSLYFALSTSQTGPSVGAGTGAGWAGFKVESYGPTAQEVQLTELDTYVGPMRVNVAAGTTVYFHGQASYPHGTGNLYNCWWTIRARRMR